MMYRQQWVQLQRGVTKEKKSLQRRNILGLYYMPSKDKDIANAILTDITLCILIAIAPWSPKMSDISQLLSPPRENAAF